MRVGPDATAADARGEQRAWHARWARAKQAALKAVSQSFRECRDCHSARITSSASVNGGSKEIGTTVGYRPLTCLRGGLARTACGVPLVLAGDSAATRASALSTAATSNGRGSASSHVLRAPCADGRTGE
eukprot:3743840-Pleurochrysis_carterae.AAC.1